MLQAQQLRKNGALTSLRPEQEKKRKGHSMTKGKREESIEEVYEQKKRKKKRIGKETVTEREGRIEEEGDRK